MFIEPMKGISEVSKGQRTFFETTEQKNTSVFKDIFTSAINEARDSEQRLAQAEYLLATGQISDPHTVTIASTKAQTSIDLLVNLRNKALDAYNELMRMNI
ncbi:MAG: flagellar hook-basal body complex protein FliE [Clostridiales bacterium]|nr:flagellar hook-basal body complex protein FliE [Clostridiales bacterium]